MQLTFKPMKTGLQSFQREQGNVLIATLTACVLLGVGICSYLLLVSSQDQSVIRSQSWNAALDMAEAGLEEGMAQMNSSTNVNGLGYLSANGWNQSGGIYGPVTRNLSGGYYTASFMTSPPTIYSTGYVTVPINGAYVSRRVKLVLTVLPLINVPLGAIDDINMNGNGAATDSWNSYDTNLSNNGAYDSSRVRSNGSVASVNGVVNIGNHSIFGNLYLGPNASYTSGSNQVTGTIYYDYNVEFPDVVLPTNFWWSAPVAGGVHDFTSTNTLLYQTFYVNDSLPIQVEPGVQVTLHVTTPNFQPGNVTILGGLTNSGKLTIYQDAGSATFSGNGAGPGSRPDSFWYWGLPGVTSITLSGNTTFRGIIYAPEASLTLNGGGNANNLEGSSIVKSVTLNGHYDFHYDESLLTNGPPRGYVAGFWQEL
jgi:hypothetical protein